MQISFVLAWWWPPVLVSILAVLFVLEVLRREASHGGWFVGLGAALSAVPASIVAALAWALAGIFK
jgi:hypothetical protein